MSAPSADDGHLTVHLSMTSSPSAPRVPLKISKNIPVGQLRSSASEATRIPLISLKLIFRGRLIAESDKDAVAEFKLEDGCVVHCMGKQAEAEVVDNLSTAAPTSSSSAASAGASVSIPAAASPAPAAGAAESDPLMAALTKMKSECSPPSSYLTALQTLEKILSNIESHPMEEKYRRVKRGNAAFQRRLGGLPGGHDAMMAAGFSVEKEGEDEVYKILPSPEAWPKLVDAKVKIAAALSEAQRANATIPAMGQPAMGAAPAAMPGMGGMGGMPPMPPGMEEAAASMLSNPEQLQRMLQDPMVRNMMRNDPRFANNPQMAAQMEALMSDPNMMSQMSQMMSNPAMREQMMQMSRAAGGMGGSGLGGMGAAAPGAAPGAQPPTDPAAMAAQMQMLQRMMGQQGQQAGGSAPLVGQPNQAQQGGGGGGGNDQEMTEEEMIQEAIRRSLQDGSS